MARAGFADPSRRQLVLGATALIAGACTPARSTGSRRSPTTGKEASMIEVRPSSERGHAQHGWLDSHHTFSFANYYDPAHMGFGHLRVINEDRVTPGAGFPTHPHRDMEIISYVIDGALEHEDSMGNGSVIRPGEVQLMSAGTGVRHSEYNAAKDAPVHFLQIWIVPEKGGTQPRYEQRKFDWDERRDRLRPLVSPDGRDGSLVVGQNAVLFGALLSPGKTIEHALSEGRRAWVQVVRGAVEVEGKRLSAGDGAAVTAAERLAIRGVEDAELLLFDLA